MWEQWGMGHGDGKYSGSHICTQAAAIVVTHETDPESPRSVCIHPASLQEGESRLVGSFKKQGL